MEGVKVARRHPAQRILADRAFTSAAEHEPRMRRSVASRSLDRRPAHGSCTWRRHTDSRRLPHAPPRPGAVRSHRSVTSHARAAEEPSRLPWAHVDDALHCARIARTHARTFALASRLLPPVKRRAAFALYAFCRLADDLVDDQDRGADPGAAGAAVERLRERLDRALGGAPDGPVFRELAWATAEFGVPAAPLRGLVDGVARDLAVSRYETWPELASYCAGVASTVGEMCAHVFGIPGDAEVRERALGHARTLGVAMQLTNILRDVGEDARRGRCYLPAEDLARFGLDAEVVVHDPAVATRPGWAPLMRFEVARARALYAEAARGIPLLAADARPCASACATGYAAILTAIERLDYDTVSTRARVGAGERIGILWRAWRSAGRLGSPPRPPSRDAIECA
jgi:phytoene synthase